MSDRDTDLTVTTRIDAYIASQPPRKRQELGTLHERMRQLLPECRLWYLDGKDERGKTVSNPNIGYGALTMTYADGSSREFYQVGLSANTTGISVYIMGLADKAYLAETYGDRIGKATVTGYCIKFSTLANIDVSVLESAILDGVARTSV